MHRPFILALTLSLAACGTTPSDPPPTAAEPVTARTALQVLTGARDAVSNVASIRYAYRFQGRGSFNGLPTVTGTSHLSRGPDQVHSRLRVLAELRLGADADPVITEIAGDGQTITAAAHTYKRWYEGTIERGANDLIPNFGGNGLIVPFIEANPFAEELAGKLTLGGEETVSDELCDTVIAALPEQRFVAWHIARSDGLPRGRAEWVGAGDGSSAVFVHITDLEVGIDLGDDVWRVPYTDGFEKLPLGTHLAIGDPAPDFDLPILGGKRLSLADLRGKAVVLMVGASSDRVAKIAFEKLQRLHEAQGDHPYRVVGVGVPDMEVGEPAKNLEGLGVTFPYLLEGGDVVTEYFITRPGTTYVIDPSGRVTFYERKAEDLTVKRLADALRATASP